MFTFVALRIIAVVLLVAANAFFVAAEFSLVSIRDTRIAQLIEQGRVGARTVRKLHERLDEVLNGVQFGITMASLALGWIGEVAMARLLAPAFGTIPFAGIYAHSISVVVAFTLITYLHVILGEVVPKSVALQQVERVALTVAGPMDVFMTVAKPFLVMMSRSSRLVLRLFGTRAVREGGVHSPEELKLIVTASRKLGVLPPLQEEMIHRALDLETVTVREVMVPRPDIFSLPGNMPLEVAAQKVVEEQHSRVPVYDALRGPEAIIGVLYAKDLMRWMQAQLAKRPKDEATRQTVIPLVRHAMREVLVVPETKLLPDLLVDFKLRKKHLAVVVDEFGSTSGVVTVEDVLEQLVGEIEDEYDVPQEIAIYGATSFTLDGATNIRDMESQFHITLPRDEGYETLAGFVIAQLQRIPAEGDSMLYEGRRYTVDKMDRHRVESVKVELLKHSDEDRA